MFARRRIASLFFFSRRLYEIGGRRKVDSLYYTIYVANMENNLGVNVRITSVAHSTLAPRGNKRLWEDSVYVLNNKHFYH